jgi:hypothetical protein
MNDIFVVKASNHVHNGIALSDGGQELIAETFAGGSTLDETSHVDELQSGGDNLDRLVNFGQHFQSLVRDTHDTRVRFDGAKGVVGGFGALSFRQSIEERTFSYV